MAGTVELAIIQAFTAHWEITFEHMAVILNFIKTRRRRIILIMFVSNLEITIDKQSFHQYIREREFEIIVGKTK